MIGTLSIFIKNRDKEIIYKFLMMSASIMIYTSIFDLIPSSYNYISNVYNVFFSIILIIIYMFFGMLLTSIFSRKNKGESLFKLGIISMIAIIFHNIPEGMITFVSSIKDIKLGISLSFAIMLHNIPEGIAIAVPIYYSTKSRLKAFIYTFVAGFSETFGALLAYIFIDRINDYLFAIILSLTAGIMLYLSIFELIKESYKNITFIKLLKYLFIGMCLIILVKLIV